MNESKKYSCFLLWHKTPCCCVYCFRQREPPGSPVHQFYSSARLSQDTQLCADSVVIVMLSACPGLSLDLQNGHKARALRFYNSHPAPLCHLSLFYGPHGILYHYLNHSYLYLLSYLSPLFSRLQAPCKQGLCSAYHCIPMLRMCLAHGRCSIKSTGC